MTMPFWVLPLLLSVLAFVGAEAFSRGDAFGIMRLFAYGAAIIVTLLVWLIYAVVT